MAWRLGSIIFALCCLEIAGDEDLKKMVLEMQQELAMVKHKMESLEAENRRLQDSEPMEELEPGILTSDSIRPYTDIENLQIAADHNWLILCGILVFMMQLGFAMVECGVCRAKNVQHILLKNLTDVCIGIMCFWSFGFAFAYGGPYTDDGYKVNRFIGAEHFFGLDFAAKQGDGQMEPSSAFSSFFFQSAFAATAATIVSGGVAERMNFPAYLTYSAFLCAFIYPVIVSWTWGYGFLADMNEVGYMDFAGSGVVHLTGGTGALVGAIMTKPRVGRFDMPEDFAPHNLPFMVFGTLILWMGWYGFNCGSTLALHTASSGFMAAQVAMNTTLAAAAGGLTVLAARFLLGVAASKTLATGKYDIAGFCNGILAGLVSITAGCGNVECGSAVVIAMMGGCFYQSASMLLVRLKIDDPIDAFAVHGVCGAWGTLAAVFFDWGAGTDSYHGWSGFHCVQDESGNCLKGAWAQGLAANVSEVVVIIMWTAFWTAALFVPFKSMGVLVASDEEQHKGLDHFTSAYTEAYGDETKEQKRREEEAAKQAEEQAKRDAAKKNKFVPLKR